jgi:hypothetical protein
VGTRAITIDPVDVSVMARVRMNFRPFLSARLPSTMAPTGRATKPSANVASESSRLTVGSEDGKI